MEWPALRIRSLATRLILWSFVPTALILFAVAMVNFYAYQQVTEELVIGRNHELASLSSSQVKTTLNEHTALLTSVRTAEMGDDDARVRSASLKQAKNRLSVFDGGTLILNSAGVVVAADPDRPDLLGKDFSSRGYFRELLRTLMPVFSVMTRGRLARSGEMDRW